MIDICAYSSPLIKSRIRSVGLIFED